MENTTKLGTDPFTRGRDLSGGRQGAGGIGGLLARTDATGSTYYHADGNGNITALLNSQQTLVAKYLYDPFGNILSQSGIMANVNLYQFSSKELHLNSGLIHYSSRFYEPNLQRWVNRDPIGERGGLHLYAYVMNNPVDHIDPFGYAMAPNFGAKGNAAMGNNLMAIAPTSAYGYLDQPIGPVTVMVSGNIDFNSGDMDNSVLTTANDLPIDPGIQVTGTPFGDEKTQVVGAFQVGTPFVGAFVTPDESSLYIGVPDGEGGSAGIGVSWDSPAGWNALAGLLDWLLPTQSKPPCNN